MSSFKYFCIINNKASDKADEDFLKLCPCGSISALLKSWQILGNRCKCSSSTPLGTDMAWYLSSHNSKDQFSPQIYDSTETVWRDTFHGDFMLKFIWKLFGD